MTAPKRTGRAAWSPEARAKYEASVHAKREARIEDLEFLLKWDGNAESIARRAGFTSAASAERQLARWGRHDLAARLHAFAVKCDPWEQQLGAGHAMRVAS